MHTFARRQPQARAAAEPASLADEAEPQDEGAANRCGRVSSVTGEGAKVTTESTGLFVSPICSVGGTAGSAPVSAGTAGSHPPVTLAWPSRSARPARSRSCCSLALGVGGSASRAAFAPPPTDGPDGRFGAGTATSLMIGATPEEPGAGGAEMWGVGREGGSPGDERARSLHRRSRGGCAARRCPKASRSRRTAARRAHDARAAPARCVGTIAKREVVLVRDPVRIFVPTAAVPAEGESGEGGEGGEEGAPTPLLVAGEELFSKVAGAVAGGRSTNQGATRACCSLPSVTGKGEVEHQVLHWDGSGWTSEPIDDPGGERRLVPRARDRRELAAERLAARAAGLRGAYPEGAVALFRRVEEGGHWEMEAGRAGSRRRGRRSAPPVPCRSQKGDRRRSRCSVQGQPPSVEGQVLTVTSEGVWVDGARADARRRSTPRPRSSSGRKGAPVGSLEASWCLAPPATPSACSFTLPQPLPRCAHAQHRLARRGTVRAAGGHRPRRTA